MPVLPPRTTFRAMLRNRRGMAALEFALLIPLLLTMFMMIIEMGLLLLTQSALDIATRNAARLIETGQVQQAGGSDALFRSALCQVFSTSLMNCDGLVWTVASGSSFTTLYANQNNGSTAPQSSFSPGVAGDRVVVQVYYTQPLVLPLVAELLSGNGNPMLTSVTAFQNEVYQ